MIRTILTPQDFDAMDKSLEDNTIGMPSDTGISVTLWKLKALMNGYRWAIANGMVKHGEAK